MSATFKKWQQNVAPRFTAQSINLRKSLFWFGRAFAAKWVNRCAKMRATRFRFPMEVIVTDLPTSLCCQGNSGFHPSEVSKLVLDNTRTSSEPSSMKVASINHHLWYDRRLSTYDPGSEVASISTAPLSYKQRFFSAQAEKTAQTLF